MRGIGNGVLGGTEAYGSFCFPACPKGKSSSSYSYGWIS